MIRSGKEGSNEAIRVNRATPRPLALGSLEPSYDRAVVGRAPSLLHIKLTNSCLEGGGGVPLGKKAQARATRPGGKISDGALPTTTCRAKRENGGLGEDPPESTMTY
jgi:hypothetical protein